MLKILYFLLRGQWPCTHRWQIERKVELKSSGHDVFGSKQVNVGDRYYLRCEHCGEMKVFEHYCSRLVEHERNVIDSSSAESVDSIPP